MRSKILNGVENIGRSKPRGRAKPQMSRFWLIVPGIGLVAGAWFVFALFYTDYLWFSSVGYQTVLSTVLTAGLLSALTIGVAAGVLTFLNLRLAVRQSPEPPEIIYESDEDVKIALSSGQSPPISTFVLYAPIPAGITVGLLAALTGWSLGETFLRYLYQVPFGSADPIFGYNIAFYVFTLPVLDRLSAILLTLLVINFVAAASVYLGSTKIEINKTTGKMNKFEFPLAGRAHVLGLLALFFLLVAARAFLAMPNLLLMNDGAFFGASFTDVNAVLPLLWAQAAMAVLAAVFTFVCIFRKNLRWLWTGVTLLTLTWLAGLAYPAFVQRFSVAPNELGKENRVYTPQYPVDTIGVRPQ